MTVLAASTDAAESLDGTGAPVLAGVFVVGKLRKVRSSVDA